MREDIRRWGIIANEQVVSFLLLLSQAHFTFFILLSLHDFYFFHCSWFTVFCQCLLYSKMTQSFIYIYVCVYIYIYIHIYTHVILHRDVPSQMIRFRFLSYTAESHCLSTPEQVVSFGGRNIFQKLDCGNGCTTLWIYDETLNSSL